MTSRQITFPLRTFGLGCVSAVLGGAVWRLPAPLDVPGPWLFAGGLALAGAAVYYHVRRRRASAAVLDKWGRQSRRNRGVASAYAILKSAFQIRRMAGVLRPSLAEVGFWDRWMHPMSAYATRLARVGRLWIWSAAEEVVLILGGPRKGKTQALACYVVDAPGAAVVTSTRKDIVEWTAPSRSKLGPIVIFNPSGIAGWASTLKWSPLFGCKDIGTAQRRAADLIPEAGDARGERWDIQARDTLAVLMHAAALNDLPMRAVLAWISDPDPARAGQFVDRALARSTEMATLRDSARLFFGLNPATRTSVTATMRPALRWLQDSKVAAIGDATPDDQVDIAELITDNATIYLLGKEDGIVAPLVAALTAEIAHQARDLAEKAPGGRLDPALTLALDEAAVICRVPLPSWTADMGGRGVKIFVCVQSRAQLMDKWGAEGAASILANTNTTLLFGGGANAGDLKEWSTLAGEREVPIANLDPDGSVMSTSTRKEATLSVDRIKQLPKHTAIVERDGLAVSIGRTPIAGQRKDILAARQANPFSPIVETSYAATMQEDEL